MFRHRSCHIMMKCLPVDWKPVCVGACRITVGGKTRFVCVDGPEFDGHQVDFDEMLKRMGAFKDIEKEEIHKLDTAGMPNGVQAYVKP